MKREIAERLAATTVEGLTVADAQKVIATFLSHLGVCPVCDGTGEFTFGRDVYIVTAQKDRRTDLIDRYIPAGTTASCPRCGAQDEAERGQGDPEYVVWHCFQGSSDQRCVADRKDAEDRRNGHATCGFRIVLPYDGVNTDGS